MPSWRVPAVQESSCGAFTLGDLVVLGTRSPDVHNNVLHLFKVLGEKASLHQKAGRLASLHLPPVMMR